MKEEISSGATMLGWKTLKLVVWGQERQPVKKTKGRLWAIGTSRMAKALHESDIQETSLPLVLSEELVVSIHHKPAMISVLSDGIQEMHWSANALW